MLARMRKSHLSVTIIYVRGEQFVELSAMVGRTPFEVSDNGNVLHQFESRDYLITAADLVLGSAVTLPQPGDLITEVINGVTCYYQVLSQTGAPCYRYTDGSCIELRIHTKKIPTPPGD